MSLVLLVKISPRLSRKVVLPQVPESVEDLQDILREKLQLQGNFTLQFEDPAFNNILCNLFDIQELPPERAILHILWDEAPVQVVQQQSDSASSLDTASLPSSESPQSPSTFIRNYLRSQSEWPTPFPIPDFSYDVEFKLRKGNEAYERTRKGIVVTRDMKIDILDKIAKAVFEVKAYPELEQLHSVASALITKHPCLREPSGATGHDGWTNSLKYKMGNYRTKLREAGCAEVSINRKRKSSDDDGVGHSLKRAKRGEMNHVPDHPDGHTDDTLEDKRLAMVEELKKRNRNVTLIKQQMQLTYSLRRREIVEIQPMVSEVHERWPALFFQSEIGEEFRRITNKNLIDDFRAAISQHTPGLLRLYRARATAFPPEMDQLLEKLDNETSDITVHRQTAALKGLPLYLRDCHKELFKTCLETDPEEQQTEGVTVGILTVMEDDGLAAPSRVQNIAVIMEAHIVLQDLPDIPTAVAYLFGLIYALNLKYPKKLRYTFETIQTVFMGLATDLSARVRSLQNKLLQ